MSPCTLHSWTSKLTCDESMLHPTVVPNVKTHLIFEENARILTYFIFGSNVPNNRLTLTLSYHTELNPYCGLHCHHPLMPMCMFLALVRILVPAHSTRQHQRSAIIQFVHQIVSTRSEFKASHNHAFKSNFTMAANQVL